MARIYTYPNDTALRDEDAWIGTNYPDLATVQFTAKKIADYLNFNGRISVAGHLVYKYDYNQESNAGTISLFAGGPVIAFSAITELYIHKNDLAAQFTPNFLAVLVSKEILMAEVGDINNFGHYRVNSYAASITNPDFYILNLTELNSNGSLSNESIYSIIQFNLSGDKTFVFTQGATSATWNITHTLSKYPSVSVVDSGGNLIYPQVTYNSLTEITLSFKAALSGKAYLN